MTMRFVLYTHSYSPHEMPLFNACAKVFNDAVYVVDVPWNADPSRGGWVPDPQGGGTLVLGQMPEEERFSRFKNLLDSNTVIIYGQRSNPYEELIHSSSALIIYASERWLKPDGIHIPRTKLRVPLPGLLHLLRLSFLKAVWRMRRRVRENPRFHYFAEGLHAASDMMALTGIGERRNLWGQESGWRPTEQVANVPWLHMWGYFVSPSVGSVAHRRSGDAGVIRMLWVGRMLRLKRVGDLISAVNRVQRAGVTCQLDLYGHGEDEKRLRRQAEGMTNVFFHDYVPMAKVRELMRSHDVFVLCSDGYEGWGAVINEALEEGMGVLCSRQAGAGATMLPSECLFDAGDVDALVEKLKRPIPRPGIGNWNVNKAAEALKEFADAH